MEMCIKKCVCLILPFLLQMTHSEIISGKRFSRAVKAPLITPLQFYYMKNYYNPFWYGGPLDGGDKFDGPFGGFAPNPFARPTAPPKSDKSTTAKPDTSKSTSAKTPTVIAPVPPTTPSAAVMPNTLAPHIPYRYNSFYDFEYDIGNYPWNEYE